MYLRRLVCCTVHCCKLLSLLSLLSLLFLSSMATSAPNDDDRRAEWADSESDGKDRRPGYEVIENPLEYFGEMTTLNGERPGGELLPLQGVEIMLDTIDADGNRLLVERGVRKAGTRVGIHVHQYGGHTCVIEGTITDFTEGVEPMLFPEGTCYYMPPNKPMAAANLGDKDAILIDTFILPPDAEPIVILEPGDPGGPES